MDGSGYILSSQFNFKCINFIAVFRALKVVFNLVRLIYENKSNKDHLLILCLTVYYSAPYSQKNRIGYLLQVSERWVVFIFGLV